MNPYRDDDEALTEALAGPEEAAAFPSAALAEDDPALFLRARGQVARARGMTETAGRADSISVADIPAGSAAAPDARAWTERVRQAKGEAGAVGRPGWGVAPRPEEPRRPFSPAALA